VRKPRRRSRLQGFAPSTRAASGHPVSPASSSSRARPKPTSKKGRLTGNSPGRRMRAASSRPARSRPPSSLLDAHLDGSRAGSAAPESAAHDLRQADQAALLRPDRLVRGPTERAGTDPRLRNRRPRGLRARAPRRAGSRATLVAHLRPLSALRRVRTATLTRVGRRRCRDATPWLRARPQRGRTAPRARRRRSRTRRDRR
jgi:hypothetical protein